VTGRVVVVGAGPGGLSAAARLRERGPESLEVMLVTRNGEATYLAGTVPAALGSQPAEHFVTTAAPDGVTCRSGEVTAVDGTGAVVDGERVDAVAVIAAPGLVPDTTGLPAWSRVRAGWDPVCGERHAADLDAVPGGRLLVVVCGLPYRCPPAPYGLAMALAHRHRRSGRFTKVCMLTPEPFPLMGVGGEAPAFLMESCAGAGVAFEGRFEIDFDASEDGVLRSRDGRELDYELAFLIPPHRRAALLHGIGPDGPLVAVDPVGETALDGLFVVGDAAATGLPRAAGVAEAQGRTAADAVLARIGAAPALDPHRPQPSCYVAHGGGAMSRIRLHYAGALPPDGEATVEIDPPSPDLAHAAEGERRRFLRLAGAA